METKNQMTDALKQVKSSFEINTIKENLNLALQEVKAICEKNEYVVEGSIDKIITDLDLGSSTLTSRKKLAKKIYFFMKKKSRKTMSSLFSFIRKRFLGEEYRVSIKPSLLEQEIISLRDNYKKSLKETEQIRISLKAKKMLFNEKGK